MSTFLSIVRFELTFHARRVSTYVYAFMWFALAALMMSMPAGRENAVINSPWKIADVSAMLMAFGTIVLSGLCGMAVCRDFEEDTYQVFFTTQMGPREYLLGRLTGSLIVSLAVFLAIPAGLLVGTVVPWADHEHMAPIRLWAYVQPYFLFIVTDILASGALFFALGALTRSVTVVYLQGVAFVALYLVVTRLMEGSLNDFWPSLFDPFAAGTKAQVSKYWTLAEMNTRLIPLAGAMLWNRLIWLGVGGVALLAALRFFPFSAEALARGGRMKTGRPVEHHDPHGASVRILPVVLRFDLASTASRFFALSRLRIWTIVTHLPFAAIVLFSVAMEVVNGWGGPWAGDTPVYPVTYLMTGNFGIAMAIVVTAMYAGEIVWQERTLRYDQVHDALPMPGWLNFASQLAALLVVQAVILAAMMASGMAQQAALGYYRFEVALYLKELFVVQWSSLILWAVMALFIQTLVPNKFAGHAIVIGIFLGPGLFSSLAEKWHVLLPSNMYDYATTPWPRYSDMNHYGPNLRPFVWYTLYWTALALVVAAVALVFARRGTDTGWRIRWRQGRARLGAPVLATMGVCLASFIGLGGYLYHDARVVNTDYTPSWVDEARRARYEREFKQYETLPQPKVTAVDVTVDLEPERAAMRARGTYTLVNTSSQPIPAVHVFDSTRTQRQLSFDRPFRETRFDKELQYHVYTFERPLAPNESVHMSFTLGREQLGFQDTRTVLVANGTFTNSGLFPEIGYQRGNELDREDQRRKQGLAPTRTDLPPPETPGVRSRNLFTQDADWISFKTTVSTAPDQIAIAPGYLTREWTEGGRRYFTYEMGDTKILKFFAFLSARYAVKRVPWHGVNIEVYYDPQHPYNVDRMIDAAKKGLDYYTASFGPYQFRQFRILEFPRYEQFAQSFANTVPYSEGIGFISHPTKEDDLDYPLYITAHELAHQWWGHQVTGAAAQGSNTLSESFSEYSALMVMEHAIGPAALRLYLKHDLDRYLKGRRGETRGEQTLARVTRQGYVWYAKGSLVMYALKDYIGEERLNTVLRNFLEKTKFRDEHPTIEDFLADLRAAVPDDQKAFVTDFFETITLFDNRAVSATWRETPDKRYAVTLRVTSSKLRADDKGNETEIPINDLVDIGIFSGKGKAEKALFLEKRRLTQHDSTFEIVVDTQPERAGLDPYNKLIDRVSDDNVVTVKKG